jgi:prepilin-type N-terminal cleavage/methylation domain-containing protein
MKENINKKRGFTIIEVVLVLAIAGLIFLMVFIALPALQRSQRNTQRRDDYSMLVTAVNSYMSSNNGKIENLVMNGSKSGGADKRYSKLDPTRWINSTGEDPNGNPYEVWAYTFKEWNSSKPQPKDTIQSTKRYDSEEYTTSGSQVFIIIKGDCKAVDENGDPYPAEDTAIRSFAVYGFLEGGGYFCQDSGSNGKVNP